MIKRLLIYVTIFIPLGSEFHRFLGMDGMDRYNFIWYGRQVISATRGLVCKEWYLDEERMGVVYECEEIGKRNPQRIDKGMKGGK